MWKAYMVDRAEHYKKNWFAGKKIIGKRQELLHRKILVQQVISRLNKSERANW